MSNNNKKHAIKIEDLEMNSGLADQYIDVIEEFLSELCYVNDRIEALNCRRYDGFIPHSWNKGGLEGVAYNSQFYASFEGTGFKTVDKKLNEYMEYNRRSWCESRGITEGTVLTDEQLQDQDEYCQEDENTVQFMSRVMMTSDTTANVDFYVSCSDSPYHRSSDEKLELEISFKSPAGMRQKLKRLLKNDFVIKMQRNIRNGY